MKYANEIRKNVFKQIEAVIRKDQRKNTFSWTKIYNEHTYLEWFLNAPGWAGPFGFNSYSFGCALGVHCVVYF